MTLLRVGAAAAADQDVIMIALRPSCINECIIRPARRAHDRNRVVRGAGNRLDRSGKRDRSRKGARDERVRAPQKGRGRESDRIGRD